MLKESERVMFVRILGNLTTGKLCAVMLLVMVPVVLSVSGSDVAFSQSGAGSHAFMYTSIDLNPNEFTMTEALGVSGGQQVGIASKTSQWEWEHALLWHSGAASAVDLLPSRENAEATAICGTQQVGYGDGFGYRGVHRHALLWHGSTASVVDLHPQGFDDSEAHGISARDQVGFGIPSTGGSHALLWHNSAASAVDLHPHGFTNSEADGTSGEEQVGSGKVVGGGGVSHALMWRGSATNVIDLNPRGFYTSEAHGLSSGQQVGYGSGPATGGDDHALLWRGSASSVVDLHPRKFLGSIAYATNGEEQVGEGDGHALLWRGSAASVVNLQTFLPPGFTESVAFGIDAAGDIVGVASTGHLGPSHAILWKRNVPRPDTSRARNASGC